MNKKTKINKKAVSLINQLCLGEYLENYQQNTCIIIRWCAVIAMCAELREPCFYNFWWHTDIPKFLLHSLFTLE